MSSLPSRILTLLSWAPVAVVVSDFIGTIHWTNNDDMAPAVPLNSVCTIRRVRRYSSLKHGQVVALVTPDGKGTILRRVVGLPGDYVQVRDTHQKSRLTSASDMRFVPPGFAWVETDNLPGKSTTALFTDEPVPVAVIRGCAVRTFPSCHTVAVIPSDRAFPSNNHQSYFAPHSHA